MQSTIISVACAVAVGLVGKWVYERYFNRRVKKLSIPRTVGILENWSVARNEADVYYGVAYCITCQVKPKNKQEQQQQNNNNNNLQQQQSQQLSKDKFIKIIREAVSQWIAGHETLNLTLDNTYPFRKLIRINNFSINNNSNNNDSGFGDYPVQIIDRKGDNTIYEVAESSINTKFTITEKSPLWKLFIIFNENSLKFDIIMRFHHVITDGISTYLLTKHFMESYGEAYKMITTNSGSNTTITMMPHGEPIEHLTNTRMPLTELIPLAVTKLLLPKFIRDKVEEKYWHGNSTLTREKINNTKTSFRYINIPNAKKLIEKCRTEKTSVHGAIMSAVHNSIAKICTNQNDVLKIQSAVSLRPIIKIISESAGVFVSETTTRITCSEIQKMGFWELAKKLKSYVESTRNECAKNLGGLHHLPKGKWVNWMKEQISIAPNNAKMSTAEISNIGDCFFRPHYGNVEIIQGFLTQQASIIGGKHPFIENS